MRRKRKALLMLNAMAITCAVCTMIMIETTHTSDVANKPPQSIVEENQNGDNASRQNKTTTHMATSWDEVSYPDMYRVCGPAKIDEKAQPGQVKYKTDNDGNTYVIATLNADNRAYGKREHGDISQLEPKGWPHNEIVTISFANGGHYKGYLWNRSHLLAHSLGGEDTLENLITGTRCQNVGKNDRKGGMQYAETLATRYLDNGGEYIIYNVYPVYNKGETIPRSVYVEMLSDDQSINMEIEVFNVAPGYIIDYKNSTWATS